MGISKTEINLRRLLAASPHQLNQPKLVHYVATLREQLEQLAEERTSDGLPSMLPVATLREQLEQLAEEKTADGLPRVSNTQVNDYSVKIEAIASKLAAHLSAMKEFQQPLDVISVEESISKAVGENPIPTSPRLRRRYRPTESVETDHSVPVKLDAAARTHIDKHRKLQDDLTDEMVGLAQQLKESSLVMTRSLKNTEKILDSTEKAVEHSLASTGHANSRALEVYSKSFTTTCFTWLVIFVMTCIFLMVVLLIRVT